MEGLVGCRKQGLASRARMWQQGGPLQRLFPSFGHPMIWQRWGRLLGWAAPSTTNHTHGTH